jgi:hypothetical protein
MNQVATRYITMDTFQPMIHGSRDKICPFRGDTLQAVATLSLAGPTSIGTEE